MPRCTLVILAAGIGSRYGGLKQIDPLGPNGEILVEYSIYDALKSGFDKVVFVINKKIEKPFRELVGRKVESRCQTDYVFQSLEDVPPGFEAPSDRIKPWGTAHATLSCRTSVDSSFAVINADDYYSRPAFESLFSALKETQKQGALYDYCLVGYRLENTLTDHGTVSRGICLVDNDGFLEQIHERTRIRRFGHRIKYTKDGETWIDLPPNQTVSLNTWGFHPTLFEELESQFLDFLQASSGSLQNAEFFLPDAIGKLIQEKRVRVKVLRTAARWFGITYQQDKLVAKRAIRELIRRGVYPERLWDKG